MLVSALKLAKGVNEDAFAHKYLKVLFDGLRLAWKVYYESFPLGADHSSGETGRRDHFN